MRTTLVAFAVVLGSGAAYAQGSAYATRTTVEKCFDVKTEILTIESCADVGADPVSRPKRPSGHRSAKEAGL